MARDAVAEIIEYNRPGSAAEGEFVGTNFERKYRKEGRPIYRAAYERAGATPSGGPGSA